MIGLFLFLAVHADPVSDRLEQRAQANSARLRAEEHASLITSNQRKLEAYLRYASPHGGVAYGECTVREENCRMMKGFGADDRESEFCMYDRYRRTSWPVSVTDAYALDNCSLVFADHLACTLSYDSQRSGFQKPTWYSAYCVPESQSQKPYSDSFPEDPRGSRRRR